MDVQDLGYGEISGRPRWLVDSRYLVERDKRLTHLVTDQKTGVEYFVPFVGPSKEHPMIEYSVVQKRGRRRIAYPETVATRMLKPGGPRCLEIQKIIEAIKD
jgi:hypothetical protein